MEELIAYILQFGTLNKQQIELITSKATALELKKNEYFSEAGKIPKQVGFVVQGVLRMFSYDNKGEEITTYFIDENRLVVDYENFVACLVSSDYLQAVTDCKFIVFSKQDWEELYQTIIDWDKIVNKAVQKAFQIHLERRTALVSKDTVTRYLSFLEQFPTLANRVPQAHIASYLGVTRFSLSRIRKNIR
ncbi:Crp/Fnr family transcriptional regulator [Adhaeribacter swui]|uniref:Crp/Fnr family transcriptional regulator n=1 Tax=Adhaeribacter swui TaxID=2086471 RepID=A0A7G7G850_9BACT|nr:Crp/Fnr family transcriptional regulator [Adhaeribacter swui]QNF33334.1 Crp/Fnr family transcriptional regulator [Adhaeribacter swui]